MTEPKPTGKWLDNLIAELIRKNEEKDARIAELEMEIATLRAQSSPRQELLNDYPRTFSPMKKEPNFEAMM